jgi:hypothetical protein
MDDRTLLIISAVASVIAAVGAFAPPFQAFLTRRRERGERLAEFLSCTVVRAGAVNRVHVVFEAPPGLTEVVHAKVFYRGRRGAGGVTENQPKPAASPTDIQDGLLPSLWLILDEVREAGEPKRFDCEFLVWPQSLVDLEVQVRSSFDERRVLAARRFQVSTAIDW